MANVTIQLDDALLEAAQLIGNALAKAGHSEHSIDREHVLTTAVNLGLHQLLTTWCPKSPFYETTPIVQAMIDARPK